MCAPVQSCWPGWHSKPCAVQLAKVNLYLAQAVFPPALRQEQLCPCKKKAHCRLPADQEEQQAHPYLHQWHISQTLSTEGERHRQGHFSHNCRLLTLLPSGKCFRRFPCHVSRLRKSFFPSAINIPINILNSYWSYRDPQIWWQKLFTGPYPVHYTNLVFMEEWQEKKSIQKTS